MDDAETAFGARRLKRWQGTVSLRDFADMASQGDAERMTNPVAKAVDSVALIATAQGTRLQEVEKEDTVKVVCKPWGEASVADFWEDWEVIRLEKEGALQNLISKGEVM